MTATVYFTEQAEREAQQDFERWTAANAEKASTLQLPEPELPWPLYTPEGQAYISTWNTLAEEHGYDVRAFDRL